MIKEIEVKSIGQYIDFVFGLDKEKNKDYKRLNYTFRGQKNKDFKLVSSLRRTYGEDDRFVENRLIENFKKYAKGYNSYISNSIWTNMVISQHHGIPTRLLDFSWSPLIAFHFALTETDNEKKEDAVVWAINIKIMHELLIPKYKNILKKYDSYSFTIEMLEELCISIQDYNNDMQEGGVIFLEPPAVDERIINQASNFAIMTDKVDSLDDFLNDSQVENFAYKFIIPYDRISYFRKQLDYMNINERIIFPGLDGLSAYLERRYKNLLGKDGKNSEKIITELHNGKISKKYF